MDFVQKNTKAWASLLLPSCQGDFFLLEETTEVFAGDQSTGNVTKGEGSDQLLSEP